MGWNHDREGREAISVPSTAIGLGQTEDGAELVLELQSDVRTRSIARFMTKGEFWSFHEKLMEQAKHLGWTN